MAEATTVTTDESTVTVEDAQAFLKEFGIEDFTKAKEVLGNYKGDIKELKSKSHNADELQKKLDAYEKATEEKRQSELSEVERLTEQVGIRDSEVENIRAEIANLKKERVFDGVMFDHMKNLSISGIRTKLYKIAVSSNDWSTPEELKSILLGVDKDLESELAGANIKLPLPGDGETETRTTGSKYDQSYFDNLNKR